MEFPKFFYGDPTKWLFKADQFFSFQGTDEADKVSLASFHLIGEANQWRQWFNKTYSEESMNITWTSFVEKLWARFGPTYGEDFNEALSRVQEIGSLRDY